MATAVAKLNPIINGRSRCIGVSFGGLEVGFAEFLERPADARAVKLVLNVRKAFSLKASFDIPYRAARSALGELVGTFDSRRSESHASETQLGRKGFLE